MADHGRIRGVDPGGSGMSNAITMDDLQARLREFGTAMLATVGQDGFIHPGR